MKSKEWKRYEKECKEFEKQMKAKEFHFSIFCEMLKSYVITSESHWKDDPAKMVKSFTKWIDSEIKMARACDKPNRPGYEFANNE